MPDYYRWQDRVEAARDYLAKTEVKRAADMAYRHGVDYKGETNSSKPTNPKDAIGSDKVPMHLWPETATVLGAMALLDGALKYGRSNFRAIGVRSSIYYDAAKRHLNKYFEGQDIDPDSGLPHLAHALASIAILIDATAAGVVTDDRMYPGGYARTIDAMTPHVKRLKDKYADRAPKHWTVQNGPAQSVPVKTTTTTYDSPQLKGMTTSAEPCCCDPRQCGATDCLERMRYIQARWQEGF